MNCKKIVSFFSTAVMALSFVSSSWGGISSAPTAYAVDNSSACSLEPGIYIAPLYQCRTGFGLDSLLNNEYQHFNGRAKLEVTEDGKQVVTIGVENWDFYKAFVPMDQEYNDLFGDKTVGKNAETSQYGSFRDAFPKRLLDELVASGDDNAKEFIESSTYCTDKVDDFFKYGDIKYGDITVETDTGHSSDSAYVSFEINDYREEFYVAAWANRPGYDGYEASRQFVLNYSDMYKADDLDKAIESNDVGFRLMLPSGAMKTATNNPVMYVADSVSSNIFDDVTTKVETDSDGSKKIIANYHVSDSYQKANGFEKLCSVSETDVTDSTAWSLYSRLNTESLTLSDDRYLTIEYKYNTIDDLIFGEYIYFSNGTNAYAKRMVYYTQPVLAPKIENHELVDESSGVKVSFKSSQVQNPENISLNVESKPVDNTTKSIVEYGYANDSSNWYKIDLIDTSTGEAAKFIGGINVYIPMPENLTSENRNNYISKLLTPYGELDGEPSLDYESRYWTDANEVYFDGTMYYFLMNLADNETERIKTLSDGIYSAEAFIFKSGPTVPTYSMSNGALVHKVYIVVENGVKKMYFNAQDISGRGYLGHIACDDVSSHSSAYTDDIVYTKYLTYDQAGVDDPNLKGQLVSNSGYDPVTEWACVTGGILTLVDDSFIISNINIPAYQVAIGAPPMAAMGNMLYSEVAVDDLVAQLQFFKVDRIADATLDNIQSVVIGNGYGYENSALLRKIEQAKMYDESEFSASTFDALTNAIAEAQDIYKKPFDDLATASNAYESQIIAIDEAIANLKAPDVTLSGYKATIEDDVTLKFMLNIPDSLQDEADTEKLAASITLADGTTKETVVKTLGRSYYVPVTVAPKEIANEISVTVGDGTFTYTVKEYLESVVDSEDATESEKAVAMSLLNYGGYAQDYFKAKDAETNAYLSDTKANEKIDSTLADISDDAVKAADIPDLGDAVSFYGASLTCEYDTAIKLYFKVDGDVAEHTFTANGVTVTPVEACDGIYCITYSGISAKNLASAYTFGVDGNNFTYGAYNYIYAALNATEVQSGALTELQNMVKAIYNYAEAAKTAE